MKRTLPVVSAYDHPMDGRLVFVMRNRDGYWEKESVGVVDEDLSAEKWNEAHDINRGEAEAMFAGSMFGWDTKAAKASSYNEDGSIADATLDG